MKRYKFSAIIQRSSGWGAFVIFPHNVLQEFGIKGRVPVQALLDKIPYTGSLMTCGTPYHLLAVPKNIREKLGKEPGDPIAVEVWKDDAPRTIEQPEDFVKLLKKKSFSISSRSSPTPGARNIATGSLRPRRRRRAFAASPRPSSGSSRRRSPPKNLSLRVSLPHHS